jgi:hypothetical protein
MRKQTRREVFLAEIERVVPWKSLLNLIMKWRSNLEIRQSGAAVADSMEQTAAVAVCA